jgi:hypothetical protein
MNIDLLVRDFDQEMTETRRALERVPDLPGYKPHSKSMPLGELAMHIATLPGLGKLILTEPTLDVTGPNGQRPPLRFESREKLLTISTKAFIPCVRLLRLARKRLSSKAGLSPRENVFSPPSLGMSYTGSSFSIISSITAHSLGCTCGSMTYLSLAPTALLPTSLPLWADDLAVERVAPGCRLLRLCSSRQVSRLAAMRRG